MGFAASSSGPRPTTLQRNELTADLRLGLIGAGRWGRNYIATVAELDGVELTAVATRRSDTTHLVTEGCRIGNRWEEVLEISDLDGIIICVPPHLQIEIARAAIHRGLPVLAEKPVALDFAEATRLLEEAAEKHAIVLVNHTYLFHPAFVELKKRAREREMTIIDSQGGNKGPFRAETSPLWDYGPHDVAMCLDLVGAKPMEVTQRIVSEELTSEGLGQVIELTLDFSDLVATLTVGNGMKSKVRRFSVHCEDTEFLFDDLADSALIEKVGDASGRAVKTDSTPPLRCAVDSFCSAIRRGESDLEGLRLGLEVMEVLARAQSHSTR